MSRRTRRLRPVIAAQAKFRCGYCHTQEVVSGIPLTVEHIRPLSFGGSDEESNLWLSCRLCNEAKGVSVEAIDPDTGEPAPLFNPREQRWDDHFQWENDATEIVGVTPVGRATVAALFLNSELRHRARAIWVKAGWHPPDVETV